MKTAQRILVCAQLAALTALAISAVLVLQAARGAALAIPVEIRSERVELMAQAAAASRELAAQIASARHEIVVRADRQGTDSRTGVLAEAAQIPMAAGQRLGDTLARADAALGRIEEVRGDLRPALSNAAALTTDAKESWDDLYWDVKASLASVTAASNNFGQMSADIRQSVPVTIKTWNGIGGNVQTITGNVERLTKPHWYDRLLGYGLNGVILYRNLNPITNLSVKGAQTIAARP